MLAKWNGRTLPVLLVGLGILALAAMGHADAPTETAKTEITLVVPVDAEVFFDEAPTVQKGTERLFVTPELVKGHKYHYTVLVRWKEGGKAVEQTRKVAVVGGSSTRVDFLKAEPNGKDQLTEEEARKLA